MAGFFSNLYKLVTGRGKGPAPSRFPSPGRPPPTPAEAKRERIRQTAADEHQTRQAARAEIGAETAGGFASLKAKIAAESAKILADLGKPFASAIEQQRQEHLERQARAERERVLTPEEKFLLGKLQLLYGRDFQSTNPSKPAVHAVWYRPAAGEIFVTFFDNSGGAPVPGPTYKYWPISEAEARTTFRYSSKGIYVWDQMRVRGSATLHKKNYALAGGGDEHWG
jgi:hypothetical protein